MEKHLENEAKLLVEEFINGIKKGAIYADTLKVNVHDIEEWEILLKESATTKEHLSIIPLYVHVAVMKRMLKGESYNTAMVSERHKFSDYIKKQSSKEPKRSQWKDLLKI